MHFSVNCNTSVVAPWGRISIPNSRLNIDHIIVSESKSSVFLIFHHLNKISCIFVNCSMCALNHTALWLRFSPSSCFYVFFIKLQLFPTVRPVVFSLVQKLRICVRRNILLHFLSYILKKNHSSKFWALTNQHIIDWT